MSEFDNRLEAMSTNEIKLLIRDLARGLEGSEVPDLPFAGPISRVASLPSPHKDPSSAEPAVSPRVGDNIPVDIHFPFVKIEGTPRRTIAGATASGSQPLDPRY